MSEEELSDLLKSRIQICPDFPKPGVLFKDIFPLFAKPSLLEDIINAFCEHFLAKFKAIKVDAVVGLDARGFLFGPLLAAKLQASFVPARKKGKLPGTVVCQSYALEYGEAALEVQKQAVKEGDKVIIIDDLLATGGTMEAACQLMQECKAEVLECMCVIELTDLNGVKKLPENVPVYSLVKYDS